MPHRNVILKILVLRFSSLGDIVMTTAMIRNLRSRFPHAQIDMVVRADFLDLIRRNPHLDRKLGLPRRSGWRGLWRLLRDLNRERYDLVYDAHRSLRTRLLMPFIKAPHKAYFQKHYLRRDLALTLKLPLIRGMPRFLERFIAPLTPYGVGYDQRGPEIFVDEETRASAHAKVTLPALATDAARIALIPSAQWPGKRWPLSYFRELLLALVEKTPHQVLVFGGPEDTFCESLAAGLPGERVVNTQGKLSIAESAALLSECALTIANDTGLMHVADGLGVPSILMLGPTSGDLGCLPFHPQSRVMEHELWCRPCSKNGQAPCIRKERYCLTLTTPERVFSETEALVAKLRAGLRP